MDTLIPVAVATLAWWGGTLLLMRVVMRSQARTGLAFAAISVLGVAALAAFGWSLGMDGTAGAYIGFFAGLVIWAWHEASYFLGWITGPRARACPPDVGEWGRFYRGVQASLYHELAIIVTGVVLLAVSWQAANPVGAITFCLLWALRWSAKLNIFLGVCNLHREYWPEHLQYLGSYARERRMNALFPVSVFAAAAGCAWLLDIALGAPATGAGRTGALLLATLLALGLVEHLFLMLRVPDGLLWRWAGVEEPAPRPARDLASDVNAGPGS